MHKIESMKTGEKMLGNFSVLPRFEPRPSGDALQCTNHYTNRDTTILLYKLRYINITSSIQHHSALFFKKG